ncbi:hypothetical protein FACS1894158_18630 [Betaproteobacteria bacterium]|nr:hypothetical protein FACS1894158_18630 [Betaproteobacteria bacterium]GHU20192.1 hypothetical protein FACS189475_08660 [Betaproteobacteria bacterium]
MDASLGRDGMKQGEREPQNDLKLKFEAVLQMDAQERTIGVSLQEHEQATV